MREDSNERRPVEELEPAGQHQVADRLMQRPGRNPREGLERLG
jgi:hypothetical protein